MAEILDTQVHFVNGLHNWVFDIITAATKRSTRKSATGQQKAE